MYETIVSNAPRTGSLGRQIRPRPFGRSWMPAGLPAQVNDFAPAHWRMQRAAAVAPRDRICSVVAHQHPRLARMGANCELGGASR